MPDSVIIFDLDNTVVDTAVRKQELLKDLGIEGYEEINNIKKDFNLEGFVGEVGTQGNDEFFSKLDSEKSINDHYNCASF